MCVLTLSNFDIRNRLVESGLELKGERVSVLPGDGSLSSCHVLVYGCAPNLHDGHIASALAEFGQLVGIIERESLTHEGVKILTGTRRALVVLQKPVPCKLRVHCTARTTAGNSRPAFAVMLLITWPETARKRRLQPAALGPDRTHMQFTLSV